jgi:hypothetical protein
VPTSKKTDIFPSVISYDLTLSAANTRTFEEIRLGMNLFDKVGLIIHRLEYRLSQGSYQELVVVADNAVLALTSSDQLTSLSELQADVIDMITLEVNHVLNANGETLLIQDFPLVHDFCDMPGGGLLVPPKPLYLGANSAGFAAALTCYIRIYFTIRKLSDTDYLELLETRRVF